MSQFELIDDYLANRMNEGARVDFEKQMEDNSLLKSEVEFQKQIIKGIKTARVTELKSMLNNVPIGGAAIGTGKVVLAALSAGLVGTLLYFAIPSGEKEVIKPEEKIVTEEAIKEEVKDTDEPTENSEKIIESRTEKPSTNVPAHRKVTKAEAPKENKVASDSPKVEVLDLTKELSSDKETSAENTTSTNGGIYASSLAVETVSGDKDYPFHYQFVDDKLVLYGPFDANLYEVIEVNGSHHSVFLYYKDGYYSLNEKQNKVVPLILIRDDVLISKLKKYRNR